MRIQQLLQVAQARLVAVTDTPLLEAEVLLAYVLNKPRSYLHAWADQVVDVESADQFNAYLTRRLQREPLAYLTGKREFWSLDLSVNPNTLIPRPETEVIVECLLTLFPARDAVIKVADLGTGTGAIALALANERPRWQISCVDIHPNTLAVAKQNARQLGKGHLSFYQGHWCSALPVCDFDVIVSNPPYLAQAEWEQLKASLAFEPKFALVAGESGLEAIQEITQSAKDYLKPGGYLLIEHGATQGPAVRDMLTDKKYHSIKSVHDLSHRERVTIGRKFFLI